MIEKKRAPWMIMGVFTLSGGLLLTALMIFVFGCSINYSSLGYQPTSYAPPSYGYLLIDNNKLELAENKPVRDLSKWSGSLHERQKVAWPMVRHLSERAGLEPALVMAVVHVESKFNPTVVSHRGAAGLMQINPPTARHLGLHDPMDPEANLKAGIKYLSTLRKMFDNDIQLMLAAYNAGPGRVQAAGGIVPPIKETQEFVDKVLAQRDVFRSRFN